jgi:hypothetical protein
MNINLLLENLTNPALLFFVLGILAVLVKSDLSIPDNSSKFIAIYLLFAIGFKGGHELAHSAFSAEILYTFVIALLAATLVPIYIFFLLKRKYTISNSAAIASSYGSVSAVTFVTAITYLEMHNVEFGGHMVAVMAIMEAPAIVVGVFLLNRYSEGENQFSMGGVLKHAMTNGSVLLIIGSLIIGFITNDAQADEIKPFTTDIFKGFLAIFLLDMGISSGRKLGDFFKKGWSSVLLALLFPLVNGTITAWMSGFFLAEVGDRFILAILVSSASYIAVPAAMKIAAPEANPGIYIPMALAITFPFNITIGMPLYYNIVLSTGI